MSNAIPWIRFHMYDWINGTDGMTLEQRDAYMTLLVRIYDKKHQLKKNLERLHVLYLQLLAKVFYSCRILNEE
ncbi:DUF1376 domain-containing protein [Bartonella sp. MU70NMGDW]|uniref:DUF1376 domain-containing protein n=1 Tax=Bartonella sp. MU70NMGDW TaxID=3243561 RepID=UPI0035CEC318